jgi:hypothetical protein
LCHVLDIKLLSTAIFLKGVCVATITNSSLTKELKIYNGEIAASSTKTAGKTG